MVFLFPGVLFRKFYYSGQFGNQFEQGNLLERFLWSLFLSFVCLSGVSSLFFFLAYFWDLHPLDNIDFGKISSMFQSLSKNEFPQSFSNKSDFTSFLFLIFIIYFISASLGWIVHNIVRAFSLDRFSIFKFKNNWHYLSQAYKENGVSRKIGDVHATFVDVLVKNNTKDELYRGILNNVILDKEDKLENIVLSNTYKFVSIDKTENEKIEAVKRSIENNENVFTLHKDYLNRTVYKKSIDGNLLVLSKENIININFTYVKTSNKVKYWKGYFFDFLRIANLLFIVGLVILPFLQVKYSYLQSIGSKVVFSITTSFIATLFLNLFGELLKIKTPKVKTSFSDVFFIIILFSTPYLWVFDILTGLGTIAFSFLIIIIFAFYQSKYQK
ncbi:hypothetical protein PMI10_04246 [Flavobacterium sp. CF136]|nr:hypothetical protein PMI10_04246 [Flavobacterium sp. CF136]